MDTLEVGGKDWLLRERAISNLLLYLQVALFVVSVVVVVILWVVLLQHFPIGGWNQTNQPVWPVLIVIGTFLWWFYCGWQYSQWEDWPVPNVCTCPSPAFVFGPIALATLIMVKIPEFRRLRLTEKMRD